MYLFLSVIVSLLFCFHGSQLCFSPNNTLFGNSFLKICVVCIKNKNQSISANLQGYATDVSGQIYLNIY